ncbi:MAG: conjugal transfer protein TraE, partial [Angelakisella sp.]
LSDLQGMKMQEQKKAAQGGYSMDILPPDLVDSLDEAGDLLSNLKDRDERMFLVTFLLLNFGSTKEELDNRCFTAKQICQKYNCELMPLGWQQE